MYCPVCMNPTMKLASTGIVHLNINGKHKDTGQFFYDLSQESHDEVMRKFKGVVDDFFEWYASFQNKDIITSVQLWSGDFICTNNCRINSKNNQSIIGSLFTQDEVIEVIEKFAKKYGFKTELNSKNVT